MNASTSEIILSAISWILLILMFATKTGRNVLKLSLGMKQEQSETELTKKQILSFMKSLLENLGIAYYVFSSAVGWYVALKYMNHEIVSPHWMVIGLSSLVFGGIGPFFMPFMVPAIILNKMKFRKIQESYK